MFFPLKPFDLSKTERTPSEYASFQHFLLKLYYERVEKTFILEYFLLDLEKKWVKKGFFKIAQEKYFYPSIVVFTVKSDIEYAIQAPYLLYSDSKAIDFRLIRFGDFRESWDIKLTDNEITGISDASFYGVVIMDGPIIALIYKDNEKVSDEEENNIYIFLWSSSLQSENRIFLKLPAHYIYGFWMDENIFQNREDIYRIVKVIYRPLYDPSIKIATFNENPSSSRPLKSSSNIISKIPEFYAKMTTCLIKSFVEEFIWIGTDQKQVICFKIDDTNEMKSIWSTIINGNPLSMVEVQLDKRTADFESILIVQITDERHVIINSENGFILHEILTECKLVIGPFFRQGFEDIISLPYFYTIDSSRWEMIDVGNFKLKIRSSAENYNDEIQVTDFSHMNSLLDSLETRVHDGIAHIRKVEEIINQKQDLLLHCDSLLESLTDIFAFNNRLQQISLTKRKFGVNRSIENLIPLLQSTSVLSNDDINDQLFSDKNDLQILESKLNINNCDKFSLEISVLNNGCKELRAIHLVVYFRNTYHVVSSSIIRMSSPYIDFLAVGQREKIISLVEFPLDPFIFELDFGVIIWYQTIDNFVVKNCWQSIFVEKPRPFITIKNELINFYPSVSYLIFNNSNSLSKQWDWTMLPSLLEQYLNVESKFSNNVSQEFQSADCSRWLTLLRPYSITKSNELGNETSINITHQLMEVRVSLPSPLFNPIQGIYGLDGFFTILEDIDNYEEINLRRFLCSKLATWFLVL
ncbi:hypothetical protein Glove_214g11 [Diversispora epigaea]|uniref:Uncharacterized protein n=1 Tax=Diversispora epigaea TaxID=1348612 RepID=A0A397IKB2_9GLOM|nr:hypothetical protein Glove_214g11 [Diversispora epigaea]